MKYTKKHQYKKHKNRNNKTKKSKKNLLKDIVTGNTALLVIDAQNKYRYVMKKGEINNMKKVVNTFKNKNLIFFTQWSMCKNTNNCKKNHHDESILYKVVKK